MNEVRGTEILSHENVPNMPKPKSNAVLIIPPINCNDNVLVGAILGGILGLELGAFRAVV